MTSPSESGAKTVNYLLISRVHESVEETLTIDPTLFVPVFLRPPLILGETEHTQSNLRLESVFKQVSADIAFSERVEDLGNTARGTAAGAKRAQIHIGSSHGDISVRIVSGSLYTASNTSQNYLFQIGPPNRCAFILQLRAIHGKICLQLPRNFHGPIIIKTDGIVRCSDPRITDLKAWHNFIGGDIIKCFLGDRFQWSGAKHGWMGDELLVEKVHGDVEISVAGSGVGVKWSSGIPRCNTMGA